MSLVLPTLYKLNKDGSVQYWKCETTHRMAYSDIAVEYGKMDTGNPQFSHEHVLEGKNIGKANETSRFDQADSQARSLWERQVKKGYVEDLAKAKDGLTDLPGVAPMLAHRFDEHGARVGYPMMVQPKLDGIRCIAVIKGGQVELFSRTRKPILSVPHVQVALALMFPNSSLILDGELYSHSLKSEFEKIASAVNKKFPSEESSKVQYHVYDAVSNLPAVARQKFLDQSVKPSSSIVRVKTDLVSTELEAAMLHNRYVREGYEGTMRRSVNGPYEHARSYLLQKHKTVADTDKTFMDEEFVIEDVIPGKKGKMADKAMFVCSTPWGSVFNCKMKGSLDKLKEILDNKDQYVGKKLTVQFQNYTGTAEKVPRFPVGLRIREEE